MNIPLFVLGTFVALAGAAWLFAVWFLVGRASAYRMQEELKEFGIYEGAEDDKTLNKIYLLQLALNTNPKRKRIFWLIKSIPLLIGLILIYSAIN